MKETQESISIWAEETFGPDGSNARIAARANLEMAELIGALTLDDNNPKAAEEVADVMIVLCRLARRLETRLPAFDYEFGRIKGACTNFNIAAQASHGLARLLWSLSVSDNSHSARSWLIDACGYLGSLAKHMDFDMREEVDKKMAINRSRQWKLDNTGHGYHVRGSIGSP